MVNLTGLCVHISLERQADLNKNTKVMDGTIVLLIKLLPLDNRETCFVMDDWVIVNEKGNWGLFDLANDIGQKESQKRKP